MLHGQLCLAIRRRNSNIWKQNKCSFPSRHPGLSYSFTSKFSENILTGAGPTRGYWRQEIRHLSGERYRLRICFPLDTTVRLLCGIRYREICREGLSGNVEVSCVHLQCLSLATQRLSRTAVPEIQLSPARTLTHRCQAGKGLSSCGKPILIHSIKVK